jgi:hypothetical protein
MTSPTSRKPAARRSALVTALVAALCTVGLIQAPSASAAETYVGQQVIKENGKISSAQFRACKVHQGSNLYKVRVRTNITSVINLGGKYRLNLGSNYGSSTTASKQISTMFATVSVLSNGKVPGTARFTTFIGKGTSAGYISWPGTTLRSFTVASIPHC